MNDNEEICKKCYVIFPKGKYKLGGKCSTKCACFTCDNLKECDKLGRLRTKDHSYCIDFSDWITKMIKPERKTELY